MRFRAFVACSILTGSLAWAGSALGQGQIIDLAQRVDQSFRLLDHSIILTVQDCAIIGDNWKRYEDRDWKMPLGSGGTRMAEGTQGHLPLGKLVARMRIV